VGKSDATPAKGAGAGRPPSTSGEASTRPVVQTPARGTNARSGREGVVVPQGRKVSPIAEKPILATVGNQSSGEGESPVIEDTADEILRDHGFDFDFLNK
jgi:hypothetical protein